MSETTGCPTDSIIEAASTWLVVLRDDGVTTAQKAAFADWLLQSSTHIREFLSCDLVWSRLQEIDWHKVAAADDVIHARAKRASAGRPSPKLH